MQDPKGSNVDQKQPEHVSVLLQEAIDFLNVRRDGIYIDGTVGLGGHSYAIASRLGPQGRLIGFDKDPAALAIARSRIDPMLAARGDQAPQVTLLHASFAEVGNWKRLVDPEGRLDLAKADGLLADVGVSSMQLGDAQRGFSFQADGPLDMRMDPQAERTADQVVNHMDETSLANVIYELGEERRSRRIARAIVRARPIQSTAHLAKVISTAAPAMKHGKGRIHPATLTFQALRIFVNRELDDLEALLKSAPNVLRSGGRLVVISFHSLEDRRVKDATREGASEGIYRLLSKKPVTASEEEIDRNPRARSAKLRAVERV